MTTGKRNQRRKIRNYHYSLRLYYKKQNLAKGMYWNIVDKMGYAPDRRLEIEKWLNINTDGYGKYNLNIIKSPYMYILLFLFEKVILVCIFG